MHSSSSVDTSTLSSALPVVLAKGEGTNISVLALYYIFVATYTKL